MMVWRLPPERAGRAPQASRHSNNAEAAAVRLAPMVAGGAATEPVCDAGAESVRVAQAPTRDATPAPPATFSS
ncbi:hypothetical protein [Mycobacterium colombiense]|uniref:hypothetical protein n=1 Tax=Mycobacterium colombiense TaxID=339268 RepID=UPI0027E289AF|nr:hypothetical protein [Mycobacterium colombiense]